MRKDIVWVMKWYEQEGEDGHTFCVFKDTPNKFRVDCLCIWRVRGKYSFVSDWMDYAEVKNWKEVKPTLQDRRDQIIYAFETQDYFEGLE